MTVEGRLWWSWITPRVLIEPNFNHDLRSEGKFHSRAGTESTNKVVSKLYRDLLLDLSQPRILPIELFPIPLSFQLDLKPLR